MKKDYLKLIDEFINLEAELNKREYDLLIELLKEHGSFIDTENEMDILFDFSLGEGTIRSVYLKSNRPFIIGISDSGNRFDEEIYAYSASEALFFCSQILGLENIQ